MPSSWNLGTLTSWNPLGHSRPVTGLVYLYLLSVCYNVQSQQVLKLPTPPTSLKTGIPFVAGFFFFFYNFSKTLLANSGNSLLIFMFKVYQDSSFIAVDHFFKKSPLYGVTCREIWGRWSPKADDHAITEEILQDNCRMNLLVSNKSRIVWRSDRLLAS